MNIKDSITISAVAVLALIALGVLGAIVPALRPVFGVAIPYAAVAIFLAGVVAKILGWGKAPVPFAIPTTCGQQKSLPWIKSSYLEAPWTKTGVMARMALEILCFRSLFRNTNMSIKEGPKIFYGPTLWLWMGALAFHYSFLTVIIRHMRFFLEPVPMPIKILENVDGFLQVGLPVMMISGFVLLGAAIYLLCRRLMIPSVRYISLPNDYFPLFLIGCIAASGILMRYFMKTDIVAVKELTMGLVTLHPVVPKTVGAIFFVHLFLVSSLLAYFPFSKLMHMGGVFMSPTRNLTCNTREVRHVNPWNYPVKTHTYEEYEDEFRALMVEAGLPVEKSLEG
jgi:nitrate reductase gamma subunit